MQATDNPTDMAINGQGFFQVQKPDGSTAYTRDGSFSVSSEGRLVTNDRYPLQPDINIPEGAQSLTICKDGTVTVMFAGDTQPSKIGQIELVNLLNPAGLQPLGDNLFAETAASGAPQAGTTSAEEPSALHTTMAQPYVVVS